MQNIQKQIEYWINNSISDFETAALLIEHNKALHGLFFCHLVIEKAIKANIVKISGGIPPKSHNLLYLCEKSNLSVSKDYEDLIGLLMKYQLEGRYPDYNPEIPDKAIVSMILEKTKQFQEWLKEKL